MYKAIIIICKQSQKATIVRLVEGSLCCCLRLLLIREGAHASAYSVVNRAPEEVIVPKVLSPVGHF